MNTNRLNAGRRIDVNCPKCDANRYAVAVFCGSDNNNHLQLVCANCNHHIVFKVGEGKHAKKR